MARATSNPRPPGAKPKAAPIVEAPLAELFPNDGAALAARLRRERRDELALQFAGMAFQTVSTAVARRSQVRWQVADFEEWANMAYSMADAMDAAQAMARSQNPEPAKAG